MKLLKLSILMSTVFMSGCAFHGIMPTQYDGEVIKPNSEAIDAYVNHGQMLNVSEIRYPFVESVELNELVDVVGKSGDTETFEAGEYDVPRDMDRGIYRLENGPEVSSSAIVVYDSEDVRVFETSLIGRNGMAHIVVDEGYRFEFKTRYGTLNVTPIESEMVDDSEGELFIPQGMYIVGEHIEAGEYDLLSEELLVMRGDHSPEVYWNSYGATYEYVMERTMTDDYRPEELTGSVDDVVVHLEVGDVVIVQKYLGLTKK